MFLETLKIRLFELGVQKKGTCFHLNWVKVRLVQFCSCSAMLFTVEMGFFITLESCMVPQKR